MGKRKVGLHQVTRTVRELLLVRAYGNLTVWKGCRDEKGEGVGRIGMIPAPTLYEGFRYLFAFGLVRGEEILLKLGVKTLSGLQRRKEQLLADFVRRYGRMDYQTCEELGALFGGKGEGKGKTLVNTWKT